MGAMNELLNLTVVGDLSRRLNGVTNGRHLSAITAGQLEPLSLRERTDLVSRTLLDTLPPGYRDTNAIVRGLLEDPSFDGWAVWPVGETVTTLALADGSADAYDDALALMAELTPRLTSEFPIRRLIEADPARALAAALGWTDHPDAHVRRLASEGTRPYLPWAIRVRALLADPSATGRILDALYRDPSDYVRRSVANHLNDLSRLDPELVVMTATRWLADAATTTPSVVRRGLRTLIKKGHPGALALLGFAPADVVVGELELGVSVVDFPGELGFTFTVTNAGGAPSDIAVDYVVHYVKKDGRLAAKVFKLATRHLAVGETADFAGRHVFRPMTTRVHYPGTHALELQINGERYGRAEFEVRSPAT
ncbi:DNA alkylation repair protein [Streptomyces sp. NPDC058665]|uniref:DNA alkylation repair protein n=1 Tax=Streptomyces sp. NPDC058665 TaxID=3346586 RepID=UPI00364D6BA7